MYHHPINAPVAVPAPSVAPPINTPHQVSAHQTSVLAQHLANMQTPVAKKIIHNYHEHPSLGLASIARPTHKGKPREFESNMNMLGDELKQLNVVTLLSLDNEMSDDIFDPVAGISEADKATQLLYAKGISYVVDQQYFVTDCYDFPSFNLADDDTFIATLDGIVQWILAEMARNPHTMLAIHCGAGDGRSGVVKSACLIAQGLKNGNSSYHQGITAVDMSAMVDTELNDSFDNVHAKTGSYKIVDDAVRNIRTVHGEAVERPSDVAMLNSYAEYYSQRVLANQGP